MSPQVYRNGKLETVSEAETDKVLQANRAKQAAREAVRKVENKNGQVVVTTEDGRTHRIGRIVSVRGNIGNIIAGSKGPINLGNGDQYVDGKKQPKKPKRNPWF